MSMKFHVAHLKSLKNSNEYIYSTTLIGVLSLKDILKFPLSLVTLIKSLLSLAVNRIFLLFQEYSGLKAE